jgi:hypothetical protein
MEDCILYLVYQLRASAYEVRFTWPNLLWISWKHHEVDYLTKKNPIIQAMIPEAPPAPPATSGGANGASRGGSQKRKQLQGPGAGLIGVGGYSNPQVTFNDEIGLINGIQPATYARFGQQPAAPRRAADYQPPASFLTAMDRPLPPPKGAVEPLRMIGGGGSAGGASAGKQKTVLDDLWGNV